MRRARFWDCDRNDRVSNAPTTGVLPTDDRLSKR
jgi:hypothetical protein